MSRDIFKLLRVPSNMTLNVSMDGISATSLDSLFQHSTTLTAQYFFLLSHLTPPFFILKPLPLVILLHAVLKSLSTRGDRRMQSSIEKFLSRAILFRFHTVTFGKWRVIMPVTFTSICMRNQKQICNLLWKFSATRWWILLFFIYLTLYWISSMITKKNTQTNKQTNKMIKIKPNPTQNKTSQNQHCYPVLAHAVQQERTVLGFWLPGKQKSKVPNLFSVTPHY